MAPRMAGVRATSKPRENPFSNPRYISPCSVGRNAGAAVPLMVRPTSFSRRLTRSLLHQSSRDTPRRRACESALNLRETFLSLQARSPRLRGGNGRGLGPHRGVVLLDQLLGRLAYTGMQQGVQEHGQAGHREGDHGVALVREGGEQDDAREDGRPAPQDDDRATLAVALAHEPVVQVLLVRL